MKIAQQPGTLPVSALHGRRSASADAARLEQINADLALSPRERMLKALDLAELKSLAVAGPRDP